LQSLRQLTPVEKQMLAQAITPQVGEIIIKVFGEEIRPIVQPLMGQGGGQMAGPESSQPVVDPTRSPLANMRS
jgi:hypothetical protein